jgi:uncharacterized OB-fold protein
MASVARKPVVAGLMKDLPGGPRLIGVRCDSCDNVYFPRVSTCRNPHCNGDRLEETALPNQGVLYSYTIQYYRPPPLFHVDEWKPYAIGLVELAGGIRVMGMLSGMEHDQICIGQAVRLVSGTLFVNDEDEEVFTYMFAPLDLPGGDI